MNPAPAPDPDVPDPLEADDRSVRIRSRAGILENPPLKREGEGVTSIIAAVTAATEHPRPRQPPNMNDTVYHTFLAAGS